MSVSTFTAKKGTKFHYDDILCRITIEAPLGIFVKELACSDSLTIDGDDFKEFTNHLTGEALPSQ